MELTLEQRGKSITLIETQVLGAGGQARVFPVEAHPEWAAKVYHKPDFRYATKLAVMVADPPEDPMAARGHASIAWPLDLLVDSAGTVVGFLMPRVSGTRPIIDYFNPKTRRKTCPGFNYFYLVRTARNLAAALHAIHSRGYVVGDVNDSNILVSPTALVTLVDTDSFQVYDHGSGECYRCPVGRLEYSAPEVLARVGQGLSYASMDRAPEQDLFGLAVLLFQLLMEGTHPFAGVYKGRSDAPTCSERILAGHFAYYQGREVPYQPAPLAPPFELLHPLLQQAFLECFVEGQKQPGARPDALAWVRLLDQVGGEVIYCGAHSQHVYWPHLKSCPWCARAARLGGRDPFPALASAPPPSAVEAPVASGAVAKPSPSGPRQSSASLAQRQQEERRRQEEARVAAEQARLAAAARLISLAEKRIPQSWQERKFVNVLRLLDELHKLHHNASGEAEARQGATQAVQEAREITEKAEQLLAGGQHSAAQVEFQKALQVCADYEAATQGCKLVQDKLRKRRWEVLAWAVGILAVVVVCAAGWYWGIQVPAQERARREQKSWEQSAAEYNRLAEDAAAVALLDYSGGDAWLKVKEFAAAGKKAVRTREGILAYQETAKFWPAAYEEAESAARESAQKGNAFAAVLIPVAYAKKRNWRDFTKWASLRDQLLKDYKSEWQEKYAAEFQREQALANQNVPFHMTMVGVLYWNGVGVKTDLGAALKWFRKAAEAGDARGQANLGLMYENGNGVAKDYAEAVKWYRKAAEQEESVAQSYVGLCYEDGRGVRRDVAEAIRWYRKAAANGSTEATLDLLRLSQK